MAGWPCLPRAVAASIKLSNSRGGCLNGISQREL